MTAPDWASPPPPDDSLIVEEWLEPFALACVSVSDESGLFDALATKPRSPAALARELNCDPVSVKKICAVLQCRGLLTANADICSLTPVASAYWVSDSPFYRGLEFLSWREWEFSKRVRQTLHQGHAPLSDEDETLSDAWQQGEVSPSMARAFTRLMHSIILGPALAAADSGVFADHRHIVDMGGGSGAFAMALKSRLSETRISVFDLPQVCAIGEEFTTRNGMQGQIEFLPGNFFDGAWPEDADGLLFSNILHDWNPDRCAELLRRAHAALPLGGRIYLHEVLLNSDGLGPPAAVVMDLMMHMTLGAQQFSAEQLFAMLGEAGFADPSRVHDFGYFSMIRASR